MQVLWVIMLLEHIVLSMVIISILLLINFLQSSTPQTFSKEGECCGPEDGAYLPFLVFVEGKK
jgi:hypothetical protein